MAIKPWYKVVTPREDLREGRPQDASEFAVHLDKVREGSAPRDYQDPRRFFERTYLTETLSSFASDVVARLSGETVETNAVYNLTTQFGGGKTHALTLVYHLARAGSKAYAWPGVMDIANRAGVPTIPEAATAVFVGTEFDSLTGRGGGDGTPLRKTPWGEIAFQLGGAESFEKVREHDERMVAPGGDVIRSFLPADRPSLILMDEIINYTNRSRRLKNGMAEQLYTFIQNLSETARSTKGVVLAVSVPASELEMNPEDQGDYNRIEKLLERVGKAYIMSAKSETAEIIRRRLFEWDGLPSDAKATIAEYADWIRENRHTVPNWFPVDQPYESFEATYPFHPLALSVFERKWQTLPTFQQTRGVLKLLALWVSYVYQKSYRKGDKAPLITLGSAPFEEPLFRAAVLKQIGEGRFEGVITTDICGNTDSHATRLDEEAGEPIRSQRLHRNVAATIFFESISGGENRTDATLPEIRLALGGPGVDIANIDTVLEGLAPPTGNCFFLNAENNAYRFGVKTNLIKIHADRKASIDAREIHDLVKENVRKVFDQAPAVERVYFPKRSGDVMDKPAVTLAVMAPNRETSSRETRNLVLELTKYHGEAGRTYKSAIIWSMASDSSGLYEAARDHLAWKEVSDETNTLNLDDGQRSQVRQYVESTKRAIKERVWETYNMVGLYTENDEIDLIDLGRVNSSASESISRLITSRLSQLEKLTDTVGSGFLVRNWSRVSPEWSTRQIRDAFFALPHFPRVMNPEVIKKTLQRGISEGAFGYAGHGVNGVYDPFYYNEPISTLQIEFSDDMFLITKDAAEEEVKRRTKDNSIVRLVIEAPATNFATGQRSRFTARAYNKDGELVTGKEIAWIAEGGEISDLGEFCACDTPGTYTISAVCEGVPAEVQVHVKEKVTPPPPPTQVTSIQWSGSLDPFKWSNFYNRLIIKLMRSGDLDLSLNFSINNANGIPEETINELRIALKELGLDDDVRTNEARYDY
ncbi:DUF499 domain-containing protein [Methanocalculus sp.]|uniref:ATP-binding protein n=1 Tax=Methanocalculus sp. TaxID=2004547 RepID=UPI0026211A4E|nr:DUF499 domain-containing protein [Methanocalculus sp.]MDG6249838.1 DUF499 domain-containing protein [Methanocalculus sp.]